MKQTRLFILLALSAILSVAYSSCIDQANAHTSEVGKTTAEGELVWHNFSDLAKLQQKESRPVLVDVYTDWCKWCKVMDEQTFKDSEMKTYLADNFYLVKLNAESKASISYKNTDYKFVNSGRRGYHQLAAALCQDKLSYPSLVLLDENLNRKRVARGFQTPDQLMHFLSES